ncbi:MAG: AsmA family protein [Sphingobium sp.]|nr:AsmA family protein [Sphingobium sp.]MBP6112311.1 AsmA family protein [Sphingobium sp.]MBP8670102.1 AsmA family protein [Sphingobium sp.]MBP9157393.1 AsmA family protein [Sphingobium sp.]
MLDAGTPPGGKDEAMSTPWLRSMRRRWRGVPRPLRWIGYALLVLFTIWLVLYITKGRFLKQPFVRIASSTAGRQIDVKGDFQLYFAPIQVKFLAEGLTIAGPSWQPEKPLFTARLLDARIATLPLLVGDTRFRHIVMDRGNAQLEWTKDGRNNWTFGDRDEPAEPFRLPEIRHAVISGTSVSYRDPRLRLSVKVGVDTIRARDTRVSDKVTFRGSGLMNGHPFTLTGGLLSPNVTLAGGANRLDLEAASGATHMTVRGTLPSATQIEGSDLGLLVRGPNLSRLFDFLGVAIPDTRTYHVTSRLTYEEEAWKFTRMNGRFGDSDLGGKMTITMPKGRVHIGAELNTQKLDILDVGPFIGYEPNSLAARGAQAAVKQTGGSPRILPDAPLRTDALQRFDADVRYTVKTVRAEHVPVSNIGLTLKLDHSRLDLSPLTFDMAGGFVSSDIVIDARKRPVATRYDIRLSPTPMSKLLSRWGAEENGTSGVIKARVEMTGEGDSVRESLASADGRIAVIIPKGSMWVRNIQLSELDIGVFIQRLFEEKLEKPVAINCGLVAFTVRDGVAAADPILIDTSKNVMIGKGSFSFKDESLDLSLRADSKKFSLFSAQSPVGIEGWFAAPSLAIISPELLTRAGVSAGLGLALSPFAAVLAFVDVGDAKSTACGPVLEGAQAYAQRTRKGKPRDDVGNGRPLKK